MEEFVLEKVCDEKSKRYIADLMHVINTMTNIEKSINEMKTDIQKTNEHFIGVVKRSSDKLDNHFTDEKSHNINKLWSMLNWANGKIWAIVFGLAMFGLGAYLK